MTTVTRIRKFSRLTATAAACVLAATSISAYSGDDDGAGHLVVPIDALVESRGYAEWSVAWWHWATAYPLAVNPLLDETGASAGLGQTGQVYFLAGNLGGTNVRTIIIPRGVNLFFPVVNSEWDTTPNLGNVLKLPDPLSVKDIRKITSYYVTGVKVACKIDGKSVHNLADYRVKSPVFSLNLDPDFAAGSGYPAPYVRTCVSDGKWLMLKPLGVGRHVIHFTANSAVTGFHLDVTYHITVAP